MRPHETTGLAFALAFAFPFLEVVVHVSAKLADGFAGEASPRPPRFAVLHVDVLGCICLGHLGDPGVGELLAVVVRGGLRISAVVRHGNGRKCTCPVVVLVRHR